MAFKLVKGKTSAILTLTAVATLIGIAWSKSVLELETTVSEFKSGLFTQCFRSFKNNYGWIYAIAFTPDSQTLVSGSYGGVIQAWNLQTGKLIHTIKAHSDAIESIAISPDGHRIASASWDNQIKLWDLKTGSLLNTFKGHTDDVKTIAISPDGRLLASGSTDKTLRLWNLTNGKLLGTFQDSDWVKSVAFSPDNKILATGSENGTIIIRWLDEGGSYTLKGHSGAVRSVVFSPDGQVLASSSADQTIKVWQFTKGKVLQTLKGHSDAVLSVAFHPDSQTLASSSFDKTIKLWNWKNGEILSNYVEHSRPVWSVAFNSQGTVLASGSGDETIKLWPVSVSRHTQAHSFQPKLDEISSEITSSSSVVQLNQKLYSQINKTWRLTPTFNTSLVYRVTVDQDGKIVDYQAMNQEATDFLQETSLPLLRPDRSKPKHFAQFKAVFKSSGVIEISPWHGWK